MPRTRKPRVILNYQYNISKPMIKKAKKAGRPRKVKAVELDNVSITPVANGYVVQSTTTGDNVYVFDELDKAFEFIRTKLKPTSEQAEFLSKV